MNPEDTPPNPLFRLVVVISAAFVLTVLMMIVTVFGSSESPVVRFFNDHGVMLIGIEVGLILLTGGAAMALDRRQTLAAMQNAEKTQDQDAAADDRPQTGLPMPDAASDAESSHSPPDAQ